MDEASTSGVVANPRMPKHLPLAVAWAIVIILGSALGVVLYAATGHPRGFGAPLTFFSPADTGWWLGNLGYSRQYKLVPASGLAGPAALVLVAIVIAVGEWAVLRWRYPVSWAWIPLTTLGLTVAESLHEAAWSIPIPPILLGLDLVAGALMGILQWLVLRRHTSRAKRWIGAVMFAWLLASFTIFLLPLPRLSELHDLGEIDEQAQREITQAWEQQGTVLFSLAAVGRGAVIGSVTGLAMQRLVHPSRETQVAP